MLPQNSRLLFKAIVGSTCYGLATETSDVDYKSIYLQSNEDILSNNYIPQIDFDKDNVGYELRRFLELVSTGNPNVLELLFLSREFILETSPEYEFLRKNREVFLTKQCYNTYANYAKGQIQKATGLNKKFNWEDKRIERQDVLDFCKIIDRKDGLTMPLKQWLKKNEYKQEQCGLAHIEGFRDCYRVYVDHIKWVNDNHRFTFEDRNYKGIIDENSNEPKKSIIEKYMINNWEGIIYWNRENYSTNCKEYREYQKWLKDRNPHRTATNKEHGQSFDGKNLSHTVRLILTAEEIPTQKTINVKREKERDFLLNIKTGKVDLKEIVSVWSERAEKLKELYDNCCLPEKVDVGFTKELELKIRNNELSNN